MDVILMKSVDNLGEMGDIVSVARGYARNYLIPQGMAAMATESQKAVLKEKLRSARLQEKKARTVAVDLAGKYHDLSCTLTVQAGEDDKLFGSVGPREIVASLAEQEIEFEHRQILLEEPIKQLGVYSVPVRLHAEVEVTIKVWVVKSE